MRLDMLPALAVNNPPNAMLADGESSRYLRLRLSIFNTLSNFQNIFRRKLSKVAFFSKGWIADITASAFGYSVCNIISLRSSKQVRGIDARWVIAPMQAQQISQNRPRNFKRHPVSQKRFIIIGNNPIAFTIACPLPRPTFIGASFNNLGPKMAGYGAKWLDLTDFHKICAACSACLRVCFHNMDNNSARLEGQPKYA
jgi:hypothetical protein